MNNVLYSLQGFFAVFGLLILFAVSLEKDKEIKKLGDKKLRVKYTAITSVLVLLGIFACIIQSYLYFGWYFGIW